MSTTPKTNSYSNAEYGTAIAKIIVLSGISSAIERYEMEIIIDFIRQYFKPFQDPQNEDVVINSPDYLVNIWKEGAANRFQMPENYTKLSCEYIGKVMQAFRAWRRAENMRIPVYELPKKELPPANNDAINKSIVLKDFERYKAKGIVLLGSICYDALVELDQFDETIYEDYMDRAKATEMANRIEQGKNTRSLALYRELTKSIGNNTIIGKAKTIAVEEYFKTIESIEDLGL